MGAQKMDDGRLKLSFLGDAQNLLLRPFSVYCLCSMTAVIDFDD